MTQQEEKQTRDERYDPQRIETKWFEQWQHDPALYAAEASSTKPKYYVLEMLPYPSGPCTWDMCATIQSGTLSRATCG
jgi:valyl-tRNA synthetase